MIVAYNRIIANKGSYGIDGMEAYELLSYLKKADNHESTITGRKV